MPQPSRRGVAGGGEWAGLALRRPPNREDARQRKVRQGSGGPRDIASLLMEPLGPPPGGGVSALNTRGRAETACGRNPRQPRMLSGYRLFVTRWAKRPAESAAAPAQHNDAVRRSRCAVGDAADVGAKDGHAVEGGTRPAVVRMRGRAAPNAARGRC
mmetsp:Transcript_112787/g.325849  ORF Transcript_112787/g.325849 Transcript_112787/m.325849 type:complete len:157 (+) Transcript_112787:152-622(+)